MLPKLGENLLKVLSGRISQYTSKTHTSSETRADWRDEMIILIFTEKEEVGEKELQHQLTSKFIDVDTKQQLIPFPGTVTLLFKIMWMKLLSSSTATIYREPRYTVLV